ncbi:MAG TPA: hypothetical protein VKR58_09180 [Aquella sp.]|nr:hypothetical protein [Aquella sp.]
MKSCKVNHYLYSLLFVLCLSINTVYANNDYTEKVTCTFAVNDEWSELLNNGQKCHKDSHSRTINGTKRPVKYCNASISWIRDNDGNITTNFGDVDPKTVVMEHNKIIKMSVTKHFSDLKVKAYYNIEWKNDKERNLDFYYTSDELNDEVMSRKNDIAALCDYVEYVDLPITIHH